ncbi:hypothetical protein CC2G_001922 [Coprinopsis cinerea AmutBmut pab1-1]|nr:hypothetical protein CC2G_001922 [Coprinopsis cinerea AmutBmut pab1-1]
MMSPSPQPHHHQASVRMTGLRRIGRSRSLDSQLERTPIGQGFQGAASRNLDQTILAKRSPSLTSMEIPRTQSQQSPRGYQPEEPTADGNTLTPAPPHSDSSRTGALLAVGGTRSLKTASRSTFSRRASQSRTLRDFSFRCRQLARARGENIRRSEETAYQLGCAIVHSLELVRQLVTLQQEYVSIDRELSRATTTVATAFPDDSTYSLFDSLLYQQSCSATAHHTASFLQDQDPLTSQLRHIGLTFSCNPTAIASQVTQMWADISTHNRSSPSAVVLGGTSVSIH